MTLELPILGEPVEIDGIFFETFISNPVIVAQKKGTVGRIFPEGRTVFNTGIRITNLTNRGYYFCYLVFSEVEIINPVGKRLMATFTSPWRRHKLDVWQSDFILIDAGSSIDLEIEGYVGWIADFHTKKARSKKQHYSQEYKITYKEDTWRMLLLFNPIQGHIYAQLDDYNIIFGTYQIRFKYKLDRVVYKNHLKRLTNDYSYSIRDPTYINVNIIENSWHGEILTSFLEFKIEPYASEIDTLY